MPRIALWNLFFGFALICFAAASGAILANDLSNAFMDAHETGRNLTRDWTLTLQSSAHGHTNLFGMIHIALGLTMPHARQSHRLRIGITGGLTLGALAMGPFMIWRSFLPPARHLEFNGIVIGICLCFALAALAAHTAGLWQAFARRE